MTVAKLTIAAGRHLPPPLIKILLISCWQHDAWSAHCDGLQVMAVVYLPIAQLAAMV